jgi:hypothetical protein
MTPKMAEFGWGLSDEALKKARMELNEIPEHRREAIEAIKEQMVTRPDIGKFDFESGSSLMSTLFENFSQP